jgi:phosphatidylethanolamine/phosphatidyl-N-methylethanolamine N-methyltransferase
MKDMKGLAQSHHLRSLPLFLKEALLHPWQAGAVFPSSRQLANAMARQVPTNGTGLVVELGAGTGAVTHALLRRGVQPERLVIIERSAALVASLRVRFPQLHIVHGDALHLGHYLDRNAQIDAIVSSVPLRSLPYAESQSIVEHWRAVLPVGTLIIQYTYALYGPPRHLVDDFVQLSSEVTWLNLPPARILTLRSLRPHPDTASRDRQLSAVAGL